MPKQSVTFKPRGFGFQAAQFQNADGTTSKIVYPAAANDSIVDSALITSTDSNPQNVQLIINDGTSDHIIDAVAVPAGSGTDGSHPAVDALGNAGLPLNTQGKKALFLKAGTTLKAAMVAPVTATKTITVSAQTEEF